MLKRTASRTRLQVTQLEERLTPAVALPRAAQVTLNDSGLLSIVGTPRADAIRVLQEGRDILVVVAGPRGREYRFAESQVRTITFFGGAGNDTFINDTSVSSLLHGGAGRDILQGGSANDTLCGGQGDDVLRGGAGDDELHGGPGRYCRNQLIGGDGIDTAVSLSAFDLIDLGPQTMPVPVVAEPPFAPDRIAQDIIRLTNDFRAQFRLRALTFDARLTQAAQAHATELARRGLLNHDLDGKGPGDRAVAALYPNRYVGENLARMLNQTDPATATVVGWQNSPSHRTNLLNARYRTIGIGVARAADGWVYLVQMFGG